MVIKSRFMQILFTAITTVVPGLAQVLSAADGPLSGMVRANALSTHNEEKSVIKDIE